MSIRKKGRNRFGYGGVSYSWWVEHDKWLHVCDLEKQLILKVAIAATSGGFPVATISGRRIGGLKTDRRPINVMINEDIWAESMGKTVENIIIWALDDGMKTTTGDDVEFY